MLSASAFFGPKCNWHVVTSPQEFTTRNICHQLRASVIVTSLLLPE